MGRPTDGDAVSFVGRLLGPAFDKRVIDVGPGCSRPYAAAEWHDALVVVEAGEVHLECTAGGRRAFGRGAVLCLAGLPLVALHNPGPVPAVLVAVSRRQPTPEMSGQPEEPATAQGLRPGRARPASDAPPSRVPRPAPAPDR